jgi:hypothetical protein
MHRAPAAAQSGQRWVDSDGRPVGSYRAGYVTHTSDDEIDPLGGPVRSAWPGDQLNQRDPAAAWITGVDIGIVESLRGHLGELAASTRGR